MPWLSHSLSLLSQAMRLFLFISLIIPLSTCGLLSRTQEMRSLQQRKTAWHSDLFITKYPQKPSLTATNPNDVKALKALYNATNGDYWYTHTGWLIGDPCRYGLSCSNGRVLNISLYGNYLSGSLPAELAKADALQVLNLTLNLIRRNIPTKILSMKSLQHLDLGNNILHGQLPDVLSLPNLTVLDLSANLNLHGSLPTKWDTPQLQVLDLSLNQFTGPLPESIGGLKYLKYLHLQYNNLTGTFPSSWGNLANLQHLILYSNHFNSPSIPSSWRGMKHMEEIHLDSITGSVPSWIGRSWPQLQVLFMWNGSLTGELPTSLCDLKQLEQIDLVRNSLTGEIPTCLCELTALEFIAVSENKLTGSIPDCIGRLENLSSLHLDNNYLTGTLPDSLGDLLLTDLEISFNGLYGSIPSSFSNLTCPFCSFFFLITSFRHLEPDLRTSSSPFNCVHWRLIHGRAPCLATFLRNVMHNAPNATQGTSMSTAVRVWRTLPVGGATRAQIVSKAHPVGQAPSTDASQKIGHMEVQASALKRIMHCCIH